jgi:hypothetical protein
VTRFGDQELDIGMGDVARQMVVTPSVVEPNDGRSEEPGPAEREDVVRGVVEEYRDVGRSTGVEASAVQRRESLRFEKKLSVRPHLVAETNGGPVCIGLVGSIASQEGGDVASRERHLLEGWGESDAFGHFNQLL